MGFFGGGSSAVLTTTKQFNSSATGDLSGDQAKGSFRVSAGGDALFNISNATTPELVDVFRTIQEGNQELYAGVVAGQQANYAATAGALSSAYQAQSGDVLGRLNTTLGGVGNIVKSLLPVLIVGLIAVAFIFTRKTPKGAKK